MALRLPRLFNIRSDPFETRRNLYPRLPPDFLPRETSGRASYSTPPSCSKPCQHLDRISHYRILGGERWRIVLAASRMNWE